MVFSLGDRLLPWCSQNFLGGGFEYEVCAWVTSCTEWNTQSC